MGYTTKFSGTIKTEPRMTYATRMEVMRYASSDKGRRKPLDGLCDWQLNDADTGLVHNGMEKSYDQEKWLQALIEDVLKPSGYICNGIIDCQGEDVGAIWRIYVRDNEVSWDTASKQSEGAAFSDIDPPEGYGIPEQVRQYVHELAKGYTGTQDAVMLLQALEDDDVDAVTETVAGLGNPYLVQRLDNLWRDAASYATKVNAPLSDTEAEAINKDLASGDVPRFIRSTVHKTRPDGATTDVHVTQRAKGHSLWMTTRQKLQGNPEALSAYLTERDKILVEALDDDNQATWQQERQAAEDEILANGGVRDGGIVFVSPEARDKFWASVAADDNKLPEQYSDEELGQLLENSAGHTGFPRTPLASDPKLEELRAKLHPEPEPAPPIAEIGAALQDLGTAIIGLASAGAPRVAEFLEAVMEALIQAGEQGDLAPLMRVLGAVQPSEETLERVEAAAALDDDIPDDVITAVHEGVAEAERGETNDLGSFTEYIDDVCADDEVTEAEHTAAWQKIHKEMADEEQATTRLQASYQAAYGDTARDIDANLAAWEQDLLEAEKASGPRWLIWSNKHMLWWMPNGSNYTLHINQAGRYSFDEALAIVQKSSRGWDTTQTSLPPTTMVPDPQ